MIDDFGVHPKLVEQIKLLVRKKLGRRYKQGQWRVNYLKFVGIIIVNSCVADKYEY